MAASLPNPGLRPFLPADAPLLAEIFRDSVMELTGEDYSEAQQVAWAAAADEDGASSGEARRGRLRSSHTLAGSPVGFASLEDARHDRPPLCPSGGVAQGVATLLSTRWRSSPRRAARPLDNRRERHRTRFLRAPGLRGSAPQHRAAWPRMARQHHDGEDCSAEPPKGAMPMTRERLTSSTPRCATARRPTASISPLDDKQRDRGHARRARRRLCRGRLSRRQPDSTRALRGRSEARHATLHRLRHDEAAGPLGVERSRHRGPARRQGGRDLLRRQGLGLSGRGRAGDDRRGEPRRDPRQRRGGEGAGARCSSIASTSSTATRPTRLCARLRQGRLRRRRPLGRAVRHQRRHAAA